MLPEGKEYAADAEDVMDMYICAIRNLDCTEKTPTKIQDFIAATILLFILFATFYLIFIVSSVMEQTRSAFLLLWLPGIICFALAIFGANFFRNLGQENRNLRREKMLNEFYVLGRTHRYPYLQTALEDQKKGLNSMEINYNYKSLQHRISHAITIKGASITPLIQALGPGTYGRETFRDLCMLYALQHLPEDQTISPQAYNEIAVEAVEACISYFNQNCECVGLSQTNPQ